VFGCWGNSKVERELIGLSSKPGNGLSTNLKRSEEWRESQASQGRIELVGTTLLPWPATEGPKDVGHWAGCCQQIFRRLVGKITQPLEHLFRDLANLPKDQTVKPKSVEVEIG
jgi:hypothetical protein